MRLKMSLRAGLWALAGTSVAVLAIVAGALHYASQSSTSALESFREQQVSLAQALYEIDSALKDVRLRVAGVLLDQVPVAGSQALVRDVSKDIEQQWNRYEKYYATGDNRSREHRDLAATVGKGIAALPLILNRIDAAYGKGDKKALDSVLEEDWSRVHAELVKPLEQLLPTVGAAIETEYQAATERATHMTAMAAVLVAAGSFLTLGACAFVVRLLHSDVDDIRLALEKVAQGDLTARADGRGSKEFRFIAGELNETLEQLRKVSIAAEAKERANATLMEIQTVSNRLTQVAAEVANAVRAQSSAMDSMARNVETMNLLGSQAATSFENGETVSRVVHSLTKTLEATASKTS